MIPALDPREIAFRQFWAAYPRKVAVAEARVAFARAIQTHQVADIIEGAHRYAKDVNRSDTYTPYPARWINNIGWMDGPLPPRKLTPEELAEKAALDVIKRNDLERERSLAIGKEMEEARRRAVPMPEDLRQVIQEVRKKNADG